MRKKAQFGQVISGYVDPTPEGLNKAYQRHMDNLINNEALRREAAALQAAPFEGDQNMRRELLNATDAALNAVTQEASKNSYGNLSNFTTSVMRAGTLYQKGATPINENLKRYQTYQQQLADQLEKGDIDAEDYNINLGMSKSTYKGLQVDEEGNATNYFTGIKAWQDPKIQDRINKALSQISVDGYQITGNILGYNNGMYDVETSEGVKQISADKVRAALSGVFNDPKVQGYYGRKAAGRVMGMEDEQVEAALRKEMQDLGEAENPDVARIGRIQKALDSNNSETMRGQLANDIKNDMLDSFREAAVAGKQMTQTVQSTKTSYDPIYLASVKKQMEASANGSSVAGVVFTDEAIHYQRLGGGTVEGANTEITDLEEDRAQLYENYQKKVEAGAPPEELRGMEEQLADMDRNIEVKNNVFKHVYGLDREAAKNDPEYKELQRRKRNNPLHASGGGFFSAIKLGIGYALEGMSPGLAYSQYNDYNDASRDLRDYMVDNAPVKVDPLGETGSMSMEYVPLSSFGMKPAVAKAMEQDIEDYFNGSGFKPSQQVIDPNSGQLVELGKILDEDEIGGIQFDSVTMNRSLPLNGIPNHMRIQYKPKTGEAGEKGTTGTLLVPLGPSSGISIPSVEDQFNTHSMKFLQELETYSRLLQGVGDDIMEIDWAGYRDGSMSNPFQGHMDFDISNGYVTIFDAEGKEVSPKQSITSPSLLEEIDTHFIKLR